MLTFLTLIGVVFVWVIGFVGVILAVVSSLYIAYLLTHKKSKTDWIDVVLSVVGYASAYGLCTLCGSLKVLLSGLL